MATINDCIGRRIKINKNSITIKNNAGKTCGVVRNIIRLYDMQPNMQMDYYSRLKKIPGFSRNIISIKNCIVKDGKMYVFRNIQSKLFNKKHGFFFEDEKRISEEKEAVYNAIKASGIKVIEHI